MNPITLDILAMWAPVVLPMIAAFVAATCGQGWEVLVGADEDHRESMARLADHQRAEARAVLASSVRTITTWHARRGPDNRFRKVPAPVEGFIATLEGYVKDGTLKPDQALALARWIPEVDYREEVQV
jgi:hypothetical protein